MTRYFEDYAPGQVYKHWPGRTITDFDDTWFTLMTLNTNPLHFDAAFAAKSQHGVGSSIHAAADTPREMHPKKRKPRIGYRVNEGAHQR